MAGGRYSWFPGHMVKAIKNIEQRLKLIDILVEVRDARVRASRQPILTVSPVISSSGSRYA